jgi:hypothetical protein
VDPTSGTLDQPKLEFCKLQVWMAGASPASRYLWAIFGHFSPQFLFTLVAAIGTVALAEGWPMG